MQNPLSFTKALSFSIGELNQPVITKYESGVIFFHLCRTGKYEGREVKRPKSGPDRKAFISKLSDLAEAGVLNPFQDFENVFRIIGKNIYMEEEVACTIDPFSFISHLSAMEYHGLTDRMPKIMVLSSPAQKDWKQYAARKMEKDLGKDLILYKQHRLPELTRIRFDKIRKKSVHNYSSIHLGAYKSVKDKNLRVSTIGRTFLDMPRRPDLCGGIYHVIDVYREFADTYLNLIIDELNQHGRPIDKVRAGYILEELCGITGNPATEDWQQHVTRGGSRKLDPTEEYSPRYSERWCLSINLEID